MQQRLCVKSVKVQMYAHFKDCSTYLWKEYIGKFSKVKLESSKYKMYMQ